MGVGSKQAQPVDGGFTMAKNPKLLEESTDKERLKAIATQVLGGKKLREIDFGDPHLDLDEKLRKVDLAIRYYPYPETTGSTRATGKALTQEPG
jgi:hypothetical protein